MYLNTRICFMLLYIFIVILYIQKKCYEYFEQYSGMINKNYKAY